MKKFFSLVAIAAVAATMFTSCKKDDPTPPTPPTGKAKLTLSVDNKTIAKDAEGTFTVTSDINAPEAIVVSVSSSSAATLTVDPASVTIAKGTKTITGKFRGVADGKATITIAASGVSLTVPSVEITVGTPAPVSKIVTGTLTYTTDPATDNDGDGFMLPSPDTDSGEFQIAFLWVTNNLNGTAGSAFNTVIDNYGLPCVGTVANGRVNLAIVEEDVDVSTLTFADNAGWTSANYWVCPVLYSDSYTSLAGKSGYVVMKFGYSNTENGIEEGEYIGWVKVEVSASGAVTTSDFALNCGTDAFKTGQKS